MGALDDRARGACVQSGRRLTGPGGAMRCPGEVAWRHGRLDPGRAITWVHACGPGPPRRRGPRSAVPVLGDEDARPGFPVLLVAAFGFGAFRGLLPVGAGFAFGFRRLAV